MSSASQPASTSSIVSLPDHLREPLQAVVSHLSPTLADTVNGHLKGDSIPHSVLLDVSRWAREHAEAAGLDPHDYTMLALLAGTRTTPNANFVTTEPRKATKSDRRAVTALVNAVFSVAGAGTAGWWAARSSGWTNEVCVLIGLLVAAIVAITEAILFIIWQRRKDTKPRTRLVKRIIATAPVDASSDAPTAVVPSALTEDASTLRQRKTPLDHTNTDGDESAL
ncbi:hypothetical protein EXIGLDRAFT_833615 [Exidia glandulosa HHB12029]|uniref:Endoplasmic reticulum-based factor for assembly of V-ATPase n=1 Tax=Exidia glandulosa HHB12029 TaxID=1314781 RepID=A0A166AYV9_EXIGL|nr:hypothetical protein EXIGLDRAFT_833615 [Exidia glandulosa HHB12029]